MKQMIRAASMDDWATPKDLFEKINRRYELEVDACATPENAKLPRFWTPDDDGLNKPWSWKRVWCNPPYSEKEAWIDKAIHEVRERGCTVAVLLLPSSTDTRWFHRLVFESGVCHEVVFLTPRVPFVDPSGRGRSQPANGSFLAVLRRGYSTCKMRGWRWR